MSERKLSNLKCDAGENSRNIVTVKCTLEKRCLSRAVYEQIQRDVLHISRLSIEASIYAHYSLMRDYAEGKDPLSSRVTFTKYFYGLREKPPKARAKRSEAKRNDTFDVDEYKLDQNYAALRRECGLSKFPDSRYKQNQIQFAITRFSTAFHNNLWMHAYTRLRRFLYEKIKAENLEISRSVVYTFLQKCLLKEKKTLAWENEHESRLAQFIRQDLSYDALEGLYDIRDKYKYGKYFCLFYNLQRWNERQGLRNFSLVPQLRHGRHHITLDTRAMGDILTKLKLTPKKFSKNDWSGVLKFADLERGKKFHRSIQTDGVALSLSMEKLKMMEGKKTKRTKCEPLLEKIRAQSHTYEQIIGLDPGLRLMMGGVAKRRDELDTRQGRLIKLSSAHFRHLMGENQRRQKLEHWTGDLKVETHSESPMSADYEAYTRRRLSEFEAKQAKFEERRVARLKFDKYRRTDQAAHKLARKIVGKDKGKTLIIVGSSQIAANSPVRGYVRVAQPRLLEALRRSADVLEVDEFRTTKLCSSCRSSELSTSKSPHRYQFCPKCAISFNRDVNAGLNILNVGWNLVTQGCRPVEFQRTTT